MGERDSGSKRQNRIRRDLQESNGLQRKGHIKRNSEKWRLKNRNKVTERDEQRERKRL